jgi:hypothetical protein
MKFSPSPCYFPSLRFKYSTQHNDLKYDQFISFIRIRDKGTNPYKTRDNVIIYCIA